MKIFKKTYNFKGKKKTKKSLYKYVYNIEITENKSNEEKVNI